MNIKLERFINSPTLMTWASRFARALNIIWVFPLIVTKFSTSDIEMWYSFTALIGLVSIVDFGFNSTFIRFLSFAQVSNNKDSQEYNFTADEIIPVMQRVYLVLILIAFLGFFIAYGALEVNMSSSDNPELTLRAFIVTAIGSCLFISGNYFLSYLMGINKVALVMRWDAFSNMGSVITSAIVLSNEGNILSLAIAQQSWVIFNVIRNIWLCYKSPLFKKSLNGQYRHSIFLKIGEKAWKSGIGVWMTLGVTQLLALFYAKVSSTNLGASYLLSLNILQQINVFAQAPFYSKLPLFSQLRASGDLKTLIRMAQRGMTLSYITLLVGFIGIITLGQQLLAFINSKTSLVSTELWFLMCISLLIERYGAMHIQLYTTTNKIIWHITTLVSGCLNLIGVYLMFPTYGVFALPFGSLLGNVAFYAWYSAMHSYKSIHLSFWQFEKIVWKYPIYGVLIFCMISYLLIKYPDMLNQLF